MCLAIAKPKGKIIEKQYYEEAFRRNPDGAGFAYVETLTKSSKLGPAGARHLVEDKGYFLFDSFYKALQKVEEEEMIIHFRRASSGGISAAMTHPFCFQAKLFKQYSFAVIHNGVLPFRSEETKSDTACFVHDILEPHLSRDPFFFGSATGMWMMQEIIGWNNKLVIMRYNSETDETITYIVNRKQGEEEFGCWFSNRSHHPVPTVTCPPYIGGYGYGDDYSGVPGSSFGSKRWDRADLKGWTRDDKGQWKKAYPATTAARATQTKLALPAPKTENRHVSLIAMALARHLATNPPGDKQPEGKTEQPTNIVGMDGKTIVSVSTGKDADTLTEAEWQAEKDRLASGAPIVVPREPGVIPGATKVIPGKQAMSINHLHRGDRKKFIKLCNDYLEEQEVEDFKSMPIMSKVIWIRDDCRYAVDGLNDLTDEQLDGWILTAVKELEEDFKKERLAKKERDAQLEEKTEALAAAGLQH